MTARLIVAGRTIRLSDADADLASFRWYITANGYAARNTPRPRRRMVRMHRVVLARKLGRALERDEVVDHINGDTLDNRRDNLRLATNSLNGFNRGRPAHNTTGYKGVYRNSAACRLPYQAAITINYKKHYLGSFATREEAAAAYDRAARAVAGEFARGNYR